MNPVTHSQIPSVRIEIKPSKNIANGVGVFSVRPIKKGEIVMHNKQFSDVVFFKWRKLDEVDKLTQKKIRDFCPGTKDGFFMPKDLNYLSIAWHMNHCCEPNIGFDNKFNFIAMRNIKRGEELFWDYGYDEMNPGFKMICFCKMKKCRGVITGNDWKALSQDKKIVNYLSPNVKDMLKNY